MDKFALLKSLRRQAVDRTAGERVVFHHIPKCGGTSVALSLRMRYLLSQTTVHPQHTFAVAEDLHRGEALAATVASMYQLRRQMLLYFLHEDVRCIACHVPFSGIAYETFRETYRFITILRDPVERFVSHYFHSYERDDYSRIGLALEEYVETDEARRLGATCVTYLAGLPWDADFTSPDAIAAACAHIEKFDCVGFVPDVADFATQLQGVLGVKLRIGHANRGSQTGGSYRNRLAPDLVERITELCAPDICVYDHALSVGRGSV